MSQPRCFRIDDHDNVATMLEDAPAGVVTMLGGAGGTLVTTEPIGLGHKVAVRDIGAGEAIIKYGVPIGRSRGAISRGSWVHLHNCGSSYDERSQTLELHTGAATDTLYE